MAQSVSGKRVPQGGSKIAIRLPQSGFRIAPGNALSCEGGAPLRSPERSACSGETVFFLY